MGDGSTTDRHAPVAVGLASVSAVSAGGFGSLAARTDATVATWGYNAYGQLGHATTADAHAPTAAPALAGAEATSAGPVHSLQVLADGSARAWGFGATGALGDGTTDSHPSPVAVDGLAAPGTALAAYAYRGDGLCTSKTVAGQTRPFSWDESGPVPLVLSDGERRFVYGPGGRPLYQLDAADVPTYLHQDQLGSTRQLTSATGEVVATFAYGPYGELATSTGTATTPLRFAGEYTDAETGFVYLRARYYDPGTGQFISRDPLTAMTGEPYLYAAGNPINAIEPLGLFCVTGRNPNGSCRGSGAIAKYADDISRVAGVVSSVCGVTAVLTSSTVAGAGVFGACAGIARGVSLGAGALHTAVMCADLDAYCARSAASTALAYGSGRLGGLVGPRGPLNAVDNTAALLNTARWVGQLNIEFAGNVGGFHIDTRERTRC